MNKRVSEQLLTKSQLRLGIHIEFDEDFIYLMDRDKKIMAVFTATGVTEEIIKAEAEKIIQKVSADDKK